MDMTIRPFQPSDLPALIDLTIEVFGPFYEQSFRSMVPPDLFAHQHGSWADDYRESVPKLHDPRLNKHVAVAETDAGATAGYVAGRSIRTDGMAKSTPWQSGGQPVATGSDGLPANTRWVPCPSRASRSSNLERAATRFTRPPGRCTSRSASTRSPWRSTCAFYEATVERTHLPPSVRSAWACG